MYGYTRTRCYCPECRAKRVDAGDERRSPQLPAGDRPPPAACIRAAKPASKPAREGGAHAQPLRPRRRARRGAGLLSLIAAARGAPSPRPRPPSRAAPAAPPPRARVLIEAQTSPARQVGALTFSTARGEPQGRMGGGPERRGASPLHDSGARSTTRMLGNIMGNLKMSIA